MVIFYLHLAQRYRTCVLYDYLVFDLIIQCIGSLLILNFLFNADARYIGLRLVLITRSFWYVRSRCVLELLLCLCVFLCHCVDILHSHFSFRCQRSYRRYLVIRVCANATRQRRYQHRTCYLILDFDVLQRRVASVLYYYIVYQHIVRLHRASSVRRPIHCRQCLGYVDARCILNSYRCCIRFLDLLFSSLRVTLAFSLIRIIILIRYSHRCLCGRLILISAGISGHFLCVGKCQRAING